MKFSINDRYQVSDDFETLATQTTLPFEIWAIASEIFECSSPLNSSDLVKITGLNLARVSEALDRLITEKLIHSVTLSWQDYLELRKSLPTPEPYQVEKNQAYSDESSITGYGSGQKISDGSPIRLGSISAAPPNQSSWMGMTSGSDQSENNTRENSSSSNPNNEGYRLRSLMEKIESINGGGVEGQLLVYQVFLRVPYQLLHDEGIRSLDLVNDNTLVKSQELYDSIVKATKEVTGFQLQP
jgi:hypothetical protein